MIFADRNLSISLERTEAKANAEHVTTRNRLQPDSNACFCEIAGTTLSFDGVTSPLTQTFGLGLFESIDDDNLTAIENFFEERGAPVCHEVSPLVDETLLARLSRRGYRPVEFTNVMYRPLKDFSCVDNSLLKTRIIHPSESDRWAQTCAAGWRTENEAIADYLLDFGKVSAHCDSGFPFVVERGHQFIATGMMFIIDGVALLAGASTVASARKQGAQSALLNARLQRAHDFGCTVAMMCAAPGTQSQRNAEKNGFRIAYTRIKWQKN